MPASIYDLTAKRASVDIPIGDNAIHVVYQPEFYTLAFEEAVKSARESEEKAKSFIAMFLDLVVSWDLTDGAPENPAVIPLTFDGLRKVSVNALSFIVNNIMEDLNQAGEAGASPSPAIS